MKKKYKMPEAAIKVPPTSHIFFLELTVSNKEIKSNKTHMAQGLKPSIKPRVTAKNGKETFLGSNSPIKGNLKIFGSFPSLILFKGSGQLFSEQNFTAFSISLPVLS